jgi:HD-GYP domain-containing protein (c-di-GMP phosphodiesterase class II)
VTIAVFHGDANGCVRAVTEAEEQARLTKATVLVATVPRTSADAEDPPSPVAEGSPSPNASDRLATLLAVPLVEGEAVVGTLTVGARGTRVYGQNDRALVTIVASLVTVALQSSDAIAHLEDSYFQTVTALARAMEAKDRYTAAHADTLAEMALAVGRQMALGSEELKETQYGAVLHDIGKIGVPEAILNKPGRLTADEFAVMANHTIVGESILAKIDYLLPVARIVRSAHERWDGKGYPDGLLAAQIPPASRIIFVCDAFHAMTSDRPYRAALPVDKALDELRTHAGTQFDPAVVQAFIAAWPTLETILRTDPESAAREAQPKDAD